MNELQSVIFFYISISIFFLFLSLFFISFKKLFHFVYIEILRDFGNGISVLQSSSESDLQKIAERW